MLELAHTAKIAFIYNIHFMLHSLWPKHVPFLILLISISVKYIFIKINYTNCTQLGCIKMAKKYRFTSITGNRRLLVKNCTDAMQLLKKYYILQLWVTNTCTYYTANRQLLNPRRQRSQILDCFPSFCLSWLRLCERDRTTRSILSDVDPACLDQYRRQRPS